MAWVRGRLARLRAAVYRRRRLSVVLAQSRPCAYSNATHRGSAGAWTGYADVSRLQAVVWPIAGARAPGLGTQTSRACRQWYDPSWERGRLGARASRPPACSGISM